MRFRLQDLWENLRSSYWFVPGLMAFGAILLSLVMILVDERVDSERILALRWVYINQPEGARSLLSTVAGSMITVAGVTFSVTMVVLSLTSSQYGSRLLRNFMRDAGNQVVLGTFVATFTYCLLILRTVRDGESTLFVPHLSLFVSVILAGFSVGVFIYFIHHTAESIQVSSILSRIARSIEVTVDRLYPDEDEGVFPEKVGEERPAAAGLPEGFETQALAIPSAHSAYLQTVNDEGLMQLAQEHDFILHLRHRPGDFLIKGVTLLEVYPPVSAEMTETLGKHFHFGHHRTALQDLPMLFDQLTEVALRALSPGINDPFTAIMCLDRIAEGLTLLARRKLPQAERYDEAGALRLVVPTLELTTLVQTTLGAVRRYAPDNFIVALHLLGVITLMGGSGNARFEESLRQEAQLVREGGCERFPGKDCELLESAYRKALRALTP